MRTVCFDSKDNNFNLIRFLAASLVLFSHSYPISGEGADPVFLSIISYGGLAVGVFFVLSGFLVTKSILMRGCLKRYVVNRCLRIFPALVVVALLSSFILGPLVTVLEVSEYFSNNRVYTFVWNNSTLLPMNVQYRLPGVFIDNPMKAVNGSLWTLPFELWMYVVLAVLSLFRILESRSVVNAFCLALASLLVWVLYTSALVGQLYYAVRLSALFFFGVFVYINKDWIKLSGKWALLCVLFCLALYWNKNIPLLKSVFPILLPYILFSFAFLVEGKIRLFNRLGDYSYGIYIYAFPVQQLIVMLVEGVTGLELFFYSMPLVLVLSVISWHFIESPALALKNKVFTRDRVELPLATS